MKVTEIRDCLGDPQVLVTVPLMSEEEITELMKKRPIQRTAKDEWHLAYITRRKPVVIFISRDKRAGFSK